MFRIIPEGLTFREHALLKNGQGLFLVPANENDVERVTSFMSRLSQESLRMRFMASVSQVSDQIIKDLCSCNFKDSGCLLATEGESKNAKVVGLANYISMGNNRSAEVAFLIEDAYQGLGISTLLLERLAGIAAANGLIEFEAEVLPDNQQMINVFKSSGFEIHQVWGSETVHIEFPVDSAASLWKRTALRERIAVANSLLPLLSPKIIAIIGADPDPTSIGNMIFKNIITGNFRGTVYPINEKSTPLNGVKAYSNCSELPEKIDLAIISVEAFNVIQVAQESINAGAKGVVVVSTGFAEIGKEGIERQKELVNLVRTKGVRLLGPSCLGLMNTNPDVNLNASLLPNLTPYGNIGLFAHSAALGLVILNYAQSLGLNLTTFISAGNRADVSGNDFLQYWEEDSKTEIVILYLETFGNPRKFVRIARSMSYKKPILCVKSASSVTGRKTIEKKIGGLTGGVLETQALFHQTGVILAPTLEELFDTAIVLANQPLPEGNAVGIIANSAGMVTIFADTCENNNLIVNKDSVVNLGAFTTAEKYEEAAYKLLVNEKNNALLIGFASVGDDFSDKIANAIKNAVAKSVDETGEQKTVLLCLMGTAGTISMSEGSDPKISNNKFPSFRFPESAVRALARIVAYAEYKNNPPGKIVWYSDVMGEDSRKVVNSIILESNLKEGLLDLTSDQALNILSQFGIKITSSTEKSPINVAIKSDPLFGPIIEVDIPGHKKFVRITPLTDRDLEETFENISLTKINGLKHLLGRLSQMIEELPWLYCLEVEALEEDEPTIKSIVSAKLNLNNANRPSY